MGIRFLPLHESTNFILSNYYIKSLKNFITAVLGMHTYIPIDKPLPWYVNTAILIGVFMAAFPIVINILKNTNNLPENGRKIVENVKLKHKQEKEFFDKINVTFHNDISAIPDATVRRALIKHIHQNDKIPMQKFMYDMTNLMGDSYVSVPAIIFFRSTGNLRQDTKGYAEVEEISKALLTYHYNIKKKI
jgi:hypothetical protein